MTRSLVQRGPAVRLRTLSLAALGTAVAVTGVAVVPDLLGGGDGLPSEVGSEAPLAYAITYRVEAGDTVTTEVLTVERPFRSRLTTHEGGSTQGRILSERSSDLGVLATSSGGPWGRLVVPPAPASADLRPDVALAAAVTAGLVDDLGAGTVGGRACRRYRTATSVAGGTLLEPLSGEHAEVCIDAVGLVLSERWELDGSVVRTKRAVALSFDDDPDLVVPAGDELDGSGQVERVADDAPSPFPDRFAIGALPAGFELVGRYAVVPPDLTARPDEPATAPEVATITDVWRRGADLLILDQGASVGPDPFPATQAGTPVRLADPGLDDATLVLDLRANEVRIRTEDGGFVRVSATLPPDELVAVARSLAPEGGSIGG